VILTPYLNIYF